MDTKPKISPYQLICLLLCGRLFTLLLWSPDQPEAGSLLLAIVLAPLVQWGLALLLLRLFDRVAHSHRHWLQKGLLALGWLGCMAAAVLTAGSSGAFLSWAFYGGGSRVVLTVVLLAGAVLAAFWGLEATARTATLLGAAVLVALGVLLVGAAGEAHLSYLQPPVASPMGVLGLLAYSTCTNFQLLALPLLVPYCTRTPKKRAIAGWLGLVGVVQLAVVVAVLLCLGYYAQGQPYPVYTLARCARLPVAERLDAWLMGMWVLLGFLQTALALWLAGGLWEKLWRPVAGLRRPALHGLAACLVALLLFAGCGNQHGVGRKTLVTLLELSPGPEGYRLGLEYRLPSTQKDDPPRYGVYEAQGATLAQALATLEQRESRTLWLESCRVAVVAGSDPTTLPALVEELNRQPGLRPLTSLLLAEAPLLSPEKDPEGSIATQLQALFHSRGGQLGDSFTIKDSLARSRDPLLALVLPKVQDGEGGVTLAGFVAQQGDQTGRLTVAEAQLLPLGLVAGRHSLPGQDLVQAGGCYSLVWGSPPSLTLAVLPVVFDRSTTPNDPAAWQQAYQQATQGLVTKIQQENFPDLLSLQKYWVLAQPAFWQQSHQPSPDLYKNLQVKIVVKPLASHR